jgi:DNA-binding PadR family transcriptional regulator
MKRLQVFKKLHYLKLGKNYQITDKGLRYLKELPLSHLWLEFDPITDKGLHELAEIKTLRELRIPHTRVTNAGLKLLAQMPLVALDLDGLLIDDAGLMQLTASKTLREIRIKDTLVTEEGRQKFLAQSRCKIVENHDSDYLY